MDIGAYCKIEELEHFLKENDIEIKRLRGIRLMSQETLVSEKNIIELIEKDKRNYLTNWLQQHNDCWWSSRKSLKKHKAFIYGNKHGKKEIIGYDFSKVHGKDRKHIKFAWKKIEKRYRSQFEMFNQFVGKNVMMVHARQGGGNRPWYPIDTNHPMYLCDVDDAFDNTYCDIYYDLDKGVKHDL